MPFTVVFTVLFISYHPTEKQNSSNICSENVHFCLLLGCGIIHTPHISNMQFTRVVNLHMYPPKPKIKVGKKENIYFLIDQGFIEYIFLNCLENQKRETNYFVILTKKVTLESI